MIVVSIDDVDTCLSWIIEFDCDPMSLREVNFYY